MRVAQGFFTWLDCVKEFNKRRRFLMNVVHHLSRLSTEGAFKKWADASYQIKQA
jgi:hypothetical protein